MSLRDYYLVCHYHQKRVFLTAARLAGFDDIDSKEIGQFVIEHYLCGIEVGDEDTEYLTKKQLSEMEAK